MVFNVGATRSTRQGVERPPLKTRPRSVGALSLPVGASRGAGTDVVGTTVAVDRGAGAAVRAAGLKFRSAFSLAGPGLRA